MINIDQIKNHLYQHQQYPATQEQLIAACNNLSDFSEEEKQWFTQTLPKGEYHSAEEVIQALGLMNMDETSIK